MAPFEKHPPHIRRKIALLCTLFVGIVLMVVLILHYTKPKDENDTNSNSKLQAFYDTISEKTQSLFSGN